MIAFSITHGKKTRSGAFAAPISYSYSSVISCKQALQSTADAWKRTLHTLMLALCWVCLGAPPLEHHCSLLQLLLRPCLLCWLQHRRASPQARLAYQARHLYR